MSKFRTILAIFAALPLIPATIHASSLQDWEFNINGTDYFPSHGNTFGSIPGINLSGYNSTTGLGTVQITVSTAGSNYIGGFFYVPAGIPFYNEYGAVNGSPTSGESWQIDVPEYDVVSANHGAGTIIDNLANAALNGTNSVPGISGNYLNNCGANSGGAVNAGCNDFVSMALGFNFTLAAGQTETIAFTLGSSDPGIFSLEDIHPVDGSNPTAAAVYLSGTASQGGPTMPIGNMPEPSSIYLFAAGASLLAFATIRRSRKHVSEQATK